MHNNLFSHITAPLSRTTMSHVTGTPVYQLNCVPKMEQDTQSPARRPTYSPRTGAVPPFTVRGYLSMPTCRHISHNASQSRHFTTCSYMYPFRHDSARSWSVLGNQTQRPKMGKERAWINETRTYLVIGRTHEKKMRVVCSLLRKPNKATYLSGVVVCVGAYVTLRGCVAE